MIMAQRRHPPSCRALLRERWIHCGFSLSPPCYRHLPAAPRHCLGRPILAPAVGPARRLLAGMETCLPAPQVQWRQNRRAVNWYGSGLSKDAWLRQRMPRCFVLCTHPASTHAHFGSIPAMGSISERSRLPPSTGTTQSAPAKLSGANQSGYRRRSIFNQSAHGDNIISAGPLSEPLAG